MHALVSMSSWSARAEEEVAGHGGRRSEPIPMPLPLVEPGEEGKKRKENDMEYKYNPINGETGVHPWEREGVYMDT